MADAGLIVVLSAPSGAGKTAVLSEVHRRVPGLHTTVSATTRAPRPGEEAGVHYHFLDRATFEAQREAGAFIEWAEVHGNLYGTLASEVEAGRAAGGDVVLEIDVQGMRRVCARWPDTVTIFLAPPSLSELERRLRARKTDDDDIIALRLRNAREELAARGDYAYIVVNDTLEQAADDIAAIVRAEHCRTSRQSQTELDQQEL